MSTPNKTEIRAFRKLELKQHSKGYKILNGALKNPYVLMGPAVIAALMISCFAIVYCIVISFFKWDLIADTRTFVGLYNYQYIFQDPIFLQALSNTVTYAIFIVIIGTALKVLLGVFLNKNTPAHNFVQTVMFTPHIIASVAIAVVFRYMMMPEGGVFNTILGWFGLPPSGWYMAQESALASLIFIALWHGLGYGVLIAISGLRAIPDYVYEAARLDKSSKATTMMKITMPLLSPTIFYLLITTCVGAFTTYDIVDLMTQGGPNNATMMLTYYIYEQGIRFMHYGRAMAAAVILMIICSSLTLLSFKASAKKIHYQ